MTYPSPSPSPPPLTLTFSVALYRIAGSSVSEALTAIKRQPERIAQGLSTRLFYKVLLTSLQENPARKPSPCDPDLDPNRNEPSGSQPQNPNPNPNPNLTPTSP